MAAITTSIPETIGDVRNWKLDEAREEARRLKTLVDKGTDPRELEREQAEAKARAKAATAAAEQDAESRKRYTLRSLCEAYSDLLESVDIRDRQICHYTYSLRNSFTTNEL